jgi:hypothetical protein
MRCVVNGEFSAVHGGERLLQAPDNKDVAIDLGDVDHVGLADVAIVVEDRADPRAPFRASFAKSSESSQWPVTPEGVVLRPRHWSSRFRTGASVGR